MGLLLSVDAILEYLAGIQRLVRGGVAEREGNCPLIYKKHQDLHDYAAIIGLSQTKSILDIELDRDKSK